ncbi:hypothetical protein Tco_0746167 [Tanacetum coccineum]
MQYVSVCPRKEHTPDRRSEVAVIASAAVAAVGGSKMERDEVRGWPTVVDIRGEGGVGGGRGGVVVVSIHGEGDEDESGGLVACACSWRGVMAVVARAGRIPVTCADKEEIESVLVERTMIKVQKLTLKDVIIEEFVGAVAPTMMNMAPPLYIML